MSRDSTSPFPCNFKSNQACSRSNQRRLYSLKRLEPLVAVILKPILGLSRAAWSRTDLTGWEKPVLPILGVTLANNHHNHAAWLNALHCLTAWIFRPKLDPLFVLH